MKTATYSRSALLLAMAIFLSSCGGGGGSESGSGVAGASEPPPTVKTTGVVVQNGYIQGATVGWDCNGNHGLDPDEVAVRTSARGSYAISEKPSSLCRLIAYVGSSAIDEDQPYTLTSDPFVMLPAQGNDSLITPITTVAAGLVTTGKVASADDANASLASKMGLPTGTKVLIDYGNNIAKANSPSAINATIKANAKVYATELSRVSVVDQGYASQITAVDTKVEERRSSDPAFKAAVEAGFTTFTYDSGFVLRSLMPYLPPPNPNLMVVRARRNTGAGREQLYKSLIDKLNSKGAAEYGFISYSKLGDELKTFYRTVLDSNIGDEDPQIAEVLDQLKANQKAALMAASSAFSETMTDEASVLSKYKNNPWLTIRFGTEVGLAVIPVATAKRLLHTASVGLVGKAQPVRLKKVKDRLKMLKLSGQAALCADGLARIAGENPKGNEITEYLSSCFDVAAEGLIDIETLSDGAASEGAKFWTSLGASTNAMRVIGTNITLASDKCIKEDPPAICGARAFNEFLGIFVEAVGLDPEALPIMVGIDLIKQFPDMLLKSYDYRLEFDKRQDARDEKILQAFQSQVDQISYSYYVSVLSTVLPGLAVVDISKDPFVESVSVTPLGSFRYAIVLSGRNFPAASASMKATLSGAVCDEDLAAATSTSRSYSCAANQSAKYYEFLVSSSGRLIAGAASSIPASDSSSNPNPPPSPGTPDPNVTWSSLTQSRKSGPVVGSFTLTGDASKLIIHVGRSGLDSACQWDRSSEAQAGKKTFSDISFNGPGGSWVNEGQGCSSILPADGSGQSQDLQFKVELHNANGAKIVNADAHNRIVTYKAGKTPTVTWNAITQHNSAGGQPLDGSFVVDGDIAGPLILRVGPVGSSSEPACRSELPAVSGAKNFSFWGSGDAWLPKPAANGDDPCSALLPFNGRGAVDLAFTVEVADYAGRAVSPKPSRVARFEDGQPISVTDFAITQPNGASLPITGSFSLRGTAKFIRIHAGSASKYHCYFDVENTAPVGKKEFSFSGENGGWKDESDADCSAMLTGQDQQLRFKLEIREPNGTLFTQPDGNSPSAPPTVTYAYKATSSASSVSLTGMGASQPADGEPINVGFTVSGQASSVIARAGPVDGTPYCEANAGANSLNPQTYSLSFNGASPWTSINGKNCPDLIPMQGSSTIEFTALASNSNGQTASGKASAVYTAKKPDDPPPAVTVGIDGLRASQPAAGQAIEGSFTAVGEPTSIRVHAGLSASNTLCYVDLPTSSGAKAFRFNGDWIDEGQGNCRSLIPTNGSLEIVFLVEVAGAGSGNKASQSTRATYTAVNDAPVAAFRYTVEEGTRNVVLDPTESYDRNGVIARYQWDFGDGTALDHAPEGIVQHTFTRDGTFQVALYVEDDQGTVSKSEQSVTAQQIVVVSLSETIAAGTLHSLARLKDGTLWGTGYNANSQLSGDSTADVLEFRQLLAEADMVTAGGATDDSDFSIAVLRNGKAYGVGNNAFGQLGSGATSFTNWTLIAENIMAASAGRHHTLLLTKDGKVLTSGENVYGQLGTSDQTSRRQFTEVLTGGAAIAAGSDYSMALKSDGSLWVTGVNGQGQLGLGDTQSRNQFVRSRGGIVSIAAGANQSFAITPDRKLLAVGYNRNGVLGTGDTVDRAAWTEVLPEVIAVSIRDSHALALQNGGNLKVTGINQDGQLGLGSTENKTTWTLSQNSVAAVAAGNSHSVIRKADGSLWTTGFNLKGALGTSNRNSSKSWVQVLTSVANPGTDPVPPPQPGQIAVSGESASQSSPGQPMDLHFTVSGPVSFVRIRVTMPDEQTYCVKDVAPPSSDPQSYSLPFSGTWPDGDGLRRCADTIPAQGSKNLVFIFDVRDSAGNQANNGVLPKVSATYTAASP